MALTLKVFGSGTIGSQQASNEILTAYSTLTPANAVPAGKAIIVKTLRLVNKGGVTRTVTVNYLPGGSGAKVVSPSNVSLQPGALLLLDDEMVLQPTDKLQASFGESGSDIVDFVAAGVERDQ